MLERNYYTTAEVAEIMGVSKSYAYKIVQQLNAELKERAACPSVCRSRTTTNENLPPVHWEKTTAAI